MVDFQAFMTMLKLIFLFSKVTNKRAEALKIVIIII